MRMCEMIRQEIAYPHLNVKIACSHGGVTPANDGASHQAIEDMGILRTIPNMTVVMPADYWSARKLVRAAAELDAPVYLRFTRDAVPVIYDEDEEFEIGRAKKLREGKDVAILANGDTVRLAIQAAEALAEEGIEARVYDFHTIKPLDEEAVRSCIEEIGRIVTVEDHNILNGLGSAVCELVAEAGCGKVKRIGIQDAFGQSAPYERLLAMNGVTVENIVAEAKKLVKA
jgi:transketolase